MNSVLSRVAMRVEVICIGYHTGSKAQMHSERHQILVSLLVFIAQTIVSYLILRCLRHGFTKPVDN